MATQEIQTVLVEIVSIERTRPPARVFGDSQVGPNHGSRLTFHTMTAEGKPAPAPKPDDAAKGEEKKPDSQAGKPADKKYSGSRRQPLPHLTSEVWRGEREGAGVHQLNP
jgi:hypothetical protein